MGPGVRQMMQSPEFRRMLTDPNSIRQMAQLQRALGNLRGFGVGGTTDNTGFPAPGVTNTTPEENRSQPQQTNQGTGLNPYLLSNPYLFPGTAAGNPFAALFGVTPGGSNTPSAESPTPSATSAPSGQTTAGQRTGDGSTGDGAQNQQNPFAMLFNPALLGSPPQTGASDATSGTGQQGNQAALNPFNPQFNPFLRDPALLSQVVQTMGGNNGGSGEAPTTPPPSLWPGLGAATGLGSPPQDNRPPEERYAEQLRQLNDMGFCEFERNVEALRRAGGSVQGAVEHLLNPPS